LEDASPSPTGVLTEVDRRPQAGGNRDEQRPERHVQSADHDVEDTEARGLERGSPLLGGEETADNDLPEELDRRADQGDDDPHRHQDREGGAAEQPRLDGPFPIPAARRAQAGPVRGESVSSLGTHHIPSRSWQDRKSTRLNSSHVSISYAVFC